MSIIRLTDPGDLVAPTVVVAFDSWVDAGSASTVAAEQLADGGEIVGTLDADSLFD